MPIRYQIDVARRLVVTTVQGEVSAEDLRLHAEAMASDPRRNVPLDELVELSCATESPVASQTLREFARLMRAEDHNTPGTRLAFVAPATAAFGMVRMFEAYREHPSFEIRVFRDGADAQRWLAREA